MVEILKSIGGIVVDNKKTKAYNIRFTEKEYQYIKQ